MGVDDLFLKKKKAINEEILSENIKKIKKKRGNRNKK